MSIINYAQKEISFKIVYYGTGVAGKTANLQYIYRGLPDVNRGNMVSLATGDDRTLFFDFLPVSAVTVRNFVAKFQLYTVPGQIYYNMTRKLVLRGVDFVVGLFLTLNMLRGVVYFAENPDEFGMEQATSLFIIVWAIAAVFEWRRS